MYNSARLREVPVPRADFSIDAAMNIENIGNNDEEEELQTTFFNSAELNDEMGDGDDNEGVQSDESVNETDDIEMSDAFDGMPNGRSLTDLNHARGTGDVKPVVNPEDMNAFAQLFGDHPSATSNVPDQNDSSTINTESFNNGINIESTRLGAYADKGSDGNVNGDGENLVETTQGNATIDAAKETREQQIEENVQQLILHGAKVVIDTDLEYVHMPDQELKAMEWIPQYEVKAGDALCGNKPFKPMVIFILIFFLIHLNLFIYIPQNDGSRVFMATSGEELQMTARAADGLSKLNTKKRGAEFDLRFVKAMLIGLFSISGVKEFMSFKDISGPALEVMKGNNCL